LKDNSLTKRRLLRRIKTILVVKEMQTQKQATADFIKMLDEKLNKTINELKQEIYFYKNNMRAITTQKIITYEGQAWEHWNSMFEQADSNLHILKGFVKDLKQMLVEK